MMEDYEIALRKWAWKKIENALGQESSYGFMSDYYKRFGFEKAKSWRDLWVEEFNDPGWNSDDSFHESPSSGFKIQVIGFKDKKSKIQWPVWNIETNYELGRTIFEISRIEITDEDRNG